MFSFALASLEMRLTTCKSQCAVKMSRDQSRQHFIILKPKELFLIIIIMLFDKPTEQ